MIQRLLKQAESYIGVRQGDARHKELIRRYNGVQPVPVGYPVKVTDDWCAAFVTVMGDLTGASAYFGRECGVHRFVQLFKKQKIWRGLEKPRPGDLIVFDWRKNGWMDHIGIVEKLSGNMVTVIEGNTSKCVARRAYHWNDWRIAGYARPEYPTSVKRPVKSIDAVAKEVIAGKWGNGAARADALLRAGYAPASVQKEVNRQLQAPVSKLKPNKVIAQEVLRGQWGNGASRKRKLADAGYDYQVIQKLVNAL